MNFLYATLLVGCCLISYLLGHKKGFYDGLLHLNIILNDVSDYLQERDKKNPQ